MVHGGGGAGPGCHWMVAVGGCLRGAGTEWVVVLKREPIKHIGIMTASCTF